MNKGAVPGRNVPRPNSVKKDVNLVRRQPKVQVLKDEKMDNGLVQENHLGAVDCLQRDSVPEKKNVDELVPARLGSSQSSKSVPGRLDSVNKVGKQVPDKLQSSLSKQSMPGEIELKKSLTRAETFMSLPARDHSEPVDQNIKSSDSKELDLGGSDEIDEPVQSVIGTRSELVENDGAVSGRHRDRAGLHCQPCALVGTNVEISRHHSVLDFNKSKQDSVHRSRAFSARQRRDQSKMEAIYACDINLKTVHDNKECWITSMAVLTNMTLAVADWKNRSVKIIDTVQNTVKTQIGLQSEPHDLTEIENGQVAVTLPRKGIIQLLMVDQIPVLIVRQIELERGECWGIAYSRDMFIVACCDPGNILIMDKWGTVLKTISGDAETGSGTSLFSDTPFSIAISPNHKYIYFSDWYNHSVTCMTMDGRVNVVYKDEALKYPRGLTVAGDGTVYVCSMYSNNVHQLTANLTKTQILLQGTDGLHLPYAIEFCDIEGKLFIGSQCTNNIKLYFRCS